MPLRHFSLRDVCLDDVAQKLRCALSRCTVVILDEARIGEVPLRERYVRPRRIGVLAPVHLDPLWQSCDACKVQKNCRLVRSIVRDDVRERVGAVRCHHKEEESTLLIEIANNAEYEEREFLFGQFFLI